MILLWAALNCPIGQAATGPNIPHDCVELTDTQDCGIDNHRHSLNLNEHGRYVVNHEKGEPDIVFDGLCHDEQERVVRQDDPSSKTLPKPEHPDWNRD